MRRVRNLVIRVTASLALVALAHDAFAAGRAYPRRYERGSYSQYIIKKRQGQPVVSQVYNGYASQFPPPAFLYYGYPHSGDETGIGPMTRK